MKNTNLKSYFTLPCFREGIGMGQPHPRPLSESGEGSVLVRDLWGYSKEISFVHTIKQKKCILSKTQTPRQLKRKSQELPYPSPLRGRDWNGEFIIKK